MRNENVMNMSLATKDTLFEVNEIELLLQANDTFLSWLSMALIELSEA